jgi:hypothetical protein
MKIFVSTLVSTETIGILYSYDNSNRGILDVKWRGLDFSLIAHSALKCAPRMWQSAAFRLRIAKNRITVARIATDRSMNLRADCHRPDLTACIAGNLNTELGNPQST